MGILRLTYSCKRGWQKYSRCRYLCWCYKYHDKVQFDYAHFVCRKWNMYICNEIKDAIISLLHLASIWCTDAGRTKPVCSVLLFSRLSTVSKHWLSIEYHVHNGCRPSCGDKLKSYTRCYSFKQLYVGSLQFLIMSCQWSGSGSDYNSWATFSRGGIMPLV